MLPAFAPAILTSEPGCRALASSPTLPAYTGGPALMLLSSGAQAKAQTQQRLHRKT